MIAPAGEVRAPEPKFSARVSCGRVTVFGSIRDIPAATWAGFYGGRWKDHRYLEVVEETLRDAVEHACLLVEDERGRALAVQSLFIVRQDLALGLPAILSGAVALLRRAFPNLLRPQMLMAGSLAGEGHLAVDEERSAEAVAGLCAGVEAVARSRGIRLITFKELPAEHRPAMHAAELRGYARVPSFPGVRLPIEHASFDGYLETLSKVTRKGLRRKFRESAERGAVVMELETNPSPATLDEVYRLYLQVFERADVRFEKLTRDYFDHILQRLADRARLFVWRFGGRLVAFNLCFVHEGVLYDDYLGLDYAVAHELHLYFVTFRDLLEWAAGQGLRAYYSTPLSYEPKLHLRFQLVPLDLYVRHTSRWLNPLYLRLARTLGPISGDPILPRFANFAEL